jgi:hypothetical protein
MVHFAPPMISRTYDQRRETARFARRKESFVFAGFSASSRPKTQGSEINGGFGARAADVARVSNSEMAPQAVGIAQNGLASDAAGCNRWAGDSIGRTPYHGETLPDRHHQTSDFSRRHQVNELKAAALVSGRHRSAGRELTIGLPTAQHLMAYDDEVRCGVPPLVRVCFKPGSQ